MFENDHWKLRCPECGGCEDLRVYPKVGYQPLDNGTFEQTGSFEQLMPDDDILCTNCGHGMDHAFDANGPVVADYTQDEIYSKHIWG